MTESVERTTGDQEAQSKRQRRRLRMGIVQDDARGKTIKVRIDRLMKHPKYGKYQKRRTILHAHDEKNEARLGDLVEIMESRPISKTKSWRLTRVVNKSVGR